MENKNLMETISQQARELERRDNIIKELGNKLEYTEKELEAAQILLAEQSGFLVDVPITTCFGMPFQKIYELVTAEKEGRLVEVPCNVGDTVYFIGGIHSTLIKEANVEEIYIGDGTIAIGVSTGFTAFTLQEGEFFITREEAEAKLKEMQGND